jgi:FkbM family methyltransferase
MEIRMSLLEQIKKTKRRLWIKLGFTPPPFEEIIAPLVSSQANKTISSLSPPNKKALFIDMGSNLGQGFTFFSGHYDPNLFDYCLIEANPYCIEELTKNISNLYSQNKWKGKWEVRNVAVSNKAGTIKLYGLVEDEKRGNTSDGASIIKEHNSALYNANEDQATEIPSVSASSIIQDASTEYSTIIVKMDIESVEYDALDNLIQTGLMEKINHIYVEWHSQFYSEDKIKNILIREEKLKKAILDKLTDWH